MSIIKNKIPVLEYDTDPRAVIMPDHEHIDMSLPGKAVFAFLGDARRSLGRTALYGGYTCGYGALR